ncbi:MAG: PEP-CTERM sorting domain-containing protein [Verrucomicrobiaceae bacterium]|nr:PEP-CTERM sorting domain-containing protein [Verrucomicrobiaceae bacterium]NCF93223.1 PEP-CTERM sorting domain-containing protein [Verrucomicrobiaceae bacterium]
MGDNLCWGRRGFSGFVQGAFAWRTDHGDFFFDSDFEADLSTTISVPEPSTILFLSIASLALFRRRR